MASSFVWFIYGSSLAFDEFEAWCSQHSYTLPDLSQYRKARLPNYVLALNVASKFWGGGVASISSFPGAHVEGIAVQLDISMLDLVRHKEGAQTGLYEQIPLEIELESGERVEAIGFQAAANKIDPSVAPSVRFGRALMKGAQARGLSSEWLSYLQSLFDVQLLEQASVAVSELRIRSAILSALPVSYLQVLDESGGCGAKFAVIVVSEAFTGTALIDRHRRINEALQDIMPHIHALTLKTWTPAQYHTKVQSGEAPALEPVQLCT